MMIAYFDCFSGISGDMTLGALVDAGLSIEVLELTDDGRARKVRFQFDMPLESRQLDFYYWSGGQFERLVVPALGQRRALPPATLDLHF